MKQIISFFVGLLIGIVVLSSTVVAASPVIKVLRNSFGLEINNKQVVTDRFLYNDSVYIPLRNVSEKLGCIVEWEESKKEVRIFNEYYSKVIPTPEEDFTYKGVKLKMTPKQVEALLGKPLNAIQGKEGYFINAPYIYDSCVIEFDDFGNQENIVCNIQICDKLYKTTNGIGLGDRKVDLIRKYGKPSSGEVDSHYSILFYKSDQNVTNGILFQFNTDGTIKDIEIYMVGRG